MQNASRTQNASVAETLNCSKCGWPLVKKGNLICPRCGRETPAVLALGIEDFRCPHCLEQGHRKAKCLAKANQIKCPKCGELNSLKEVKMTTEKVDQILDMIKGLPEEAKNELLKQVTSLNIEPARPISESELREKMLEFIERILNLSVAGRLEWKKTIVNYASSRGATSFFHYSTTLNSITVTVRVHERTLERGPKIIISFGDPKYEDVIFDLEDPLEKRRMISTRLFLDRRTGALVKIYMGLLNCIRKRVDSPEIQKEESEQDKIRRELFEKADEIIKSS